ncbi:MAG: choice-of-anchor B family protein [Acidobacteriota bacterium]
MLFSTLRRSRALPIVVVGLAVQFATAPAFACHVAARLHYEKASPEDREKRATELAERWINADGMNMDMTKIRYALKAVEPCSGGMADIFPCDNVDLLAHLPLADIGGGSGNDMWGWKDEASGREFALIGRSNGTSFIEVTDPETPVYLGNLATRSSSSAWRDIKVYEDHAFIVADFAGNHGMQVFDLSQLLTATPATTFSETAHYNGFARSHNIVINEETGFAYAVGSEQCSGGLHMIDVTTPTSPTFVGCYSGDAYTHDAQCVNYKGPDPDHQGKELCFASNEDTLTIVDVTDKSNPTLVSRTSYTGASYTHQGWLTEDHRRFVLDDEFDEINFGHNTRTYVWDLENLDAPSVDITYDSQFPSIDHNLYVRGRYVYQANYSIGLRVLEMDDAGMLTEVASFDTHPESNSSSGGAWSVYPFFDSGLVAISDINRGLFLLRPNLPASPIFEDGFEGGNSDAWTNTEEGSSPGPSPATAPAKPEAPAKAAPAEAPATEVSAPATESAATEAIGPTQR